MLIGYARVSTADRQPQLQLDALAANASLSTTVSAVPL
jgi:DNA invertase Pin-like site-specific DNA recombinase